MSWYGTPPASQIKSWPPHNRKSNEQYLSLYTLSRKIAWITCRCLRAELLDLRTRIIVLDNFNWRTTWSVVNIFFYRHSHKEISSRPSRSDAFHTVGCCWNADGWQTHVRQMRQCVRFWLGSFYLQLDLHCSKGMSMAPLDALNSAMFWFIYVLLGAIADWPCQVFGRGYGSCIDNRPILMTMSTINVHDINLSAISRYFTKSTGHDDYWADLSRWAAASFAQQLNQAHWLPMLISLMWGSLFKMRTRFGGHD